MPLPIPTVHPGLVTSAKRYYPQRITVERKTRGARDEYGSPTETWAPIDVSHVDIPARVVSNGPGTGAGGWSGEIYAPGGTYDVDGRTMSLMGHYPNITEMDRVLWNDDIYNIQAAESDAQGVTTRLRTRRVR